jgi:hypothetical protein
VERECRRLRDDEPEATGHEFYGILAGVCAGAPRSIDTLVTFCGYGAGVGNFCVGHCDPTLVVDYRGARGALCARLDRAFSRGTQQAGDV